MSPTVYVVAGSNGAGKTTFALKFLPKYNCHNFVNADLIARGLSPLHPEAASFRAGRLVIEQVFAFARQRVDFGFETTLSGRAHMVLLGKLKARGYRVWLIFLLMPNVKLALSRIRRRVRSGGHHVPKAVVERRFGRSLRNFFDHYRHIADYWELCDNSGSSPQSIVVNDGAGLRIIDRVAAEPFLARLGVRNK